MTKLSTELKQKGYNLFLLSNTDELHFPYIKEKFPAVNIFDNGLMLSYQLGYTKPEKEIYEKALSIYNLNPNETVFIDDREENITAAKELNIKGIVHKDYNETYKKLEKIINLEDK